MASPWTPRQRLRDRAITTVSTNFPTTAGAFDTDDPNGGDDAFVTKLKPTGTRLVYSTYLGGSGYDYGPWHRRGRRGQRLRHRLDHSTNFPTTPGAYDTSYNGGHIDAFVAKLNRRGNALVYATYLGGCSNDLRPRHRRGCRGQRLRDRDGPAPPNFPTTAGAFDTRRTTAATTPSSPS